MAKVNPKRLSDRARQELLNDFFSAVAALRTKQEVVNFFRDLLTESEAVMLARRLEIARMLADGYSYEEIRGKLGVGHDNIASVKHWLDFGYEGYRPVIERMKR